jgi:hypothetical protein
MSFFGRYVKIVLPEINKEFVSEFGSQENQPRIVVDANTVKGAYTNGSISIYGLNDSTMRLLQEASYTVEIYAGYTNVGKGLIVSARKMYVECVRVGTDVITTVYFLSFGYTKYSPESVKQDSVQEIMRKEASSQGYSIHFKNSVLAGLQVKNITLSGNLFDRLDKLKSIFDFDYYIQGTQILITTDSSDVANETNVLDIDSSDGLLSIPVYSNAKPGAFNAISFKMMFDSRVQIGKVFKITNKYSRISSSDSLKTFGGSLVESALKNVKDTKFQVFDITYNLDTRGEDFFIEVEGLMGWK